MGVRYIRNLNATVPRWFRGLSHAFAVVFAVWLGLQLYAPAAWIAIFFAVAVISALLPAFRIVGFIGLAAGLVIASVGIYLLRDGWRVLAVAGLTTGRGVTPEREALALGVASAWLMLGSVFRTQQA